MIKPVLPTFPIAVISLVLSGCLPKPEDSTSRPATSATTVAAVVDPARYEHAVAPASRPSAAPAGVAPTSQPATVAELADRAGGPAGGFIIGATSETLATAAFNRAKRANDEAEQHPARVSDVLAHATADLNGDGFITLDEVTAMTRAGLSGPILLDRLRQSKAVFSATLLQQQYLRDRGVPEIVVQFVAGPNPTTRKSIPR